MTVENGHGNDVVPRAGSDNGDITVVVADAHPVVRGGLRALFSSISGITLVDEAATGREAVKEALLHRPDVLILDLQLGELDSVAAIREIVAGAAGVAVLVFTVCEDDESVATALRAGARGYILTSAAQEEILRAVRCVAAGEGILGPRIASRLTDLFLGAARDRQLPFPELTARQREILNLIAAGAPNSTIARRLRLAPKTISNHISVIFAKLHVADRSEAIVRARDAGLGRSQS